MDSRKDSRTFAQSFAMLSARKVSPLQSRGSSRLAAFDLEYQEREKAMTQKEKIAFAQGVEEGFVRAAELSAEPEKILRQFRAISPLFRTKVTGRSQVRSE